MEAGIIAVLANQSVAESIDFSTFGHEMIMDSNLLTPNIRNVSSQSNSAFLPYSHLLGKYYITQGRS